jgi:tetratricopeptide (TPR) repeat protein
MQVTKRILIIFFIILILFQISGCKTLFTDEGRLYSQSKSLVRYKNYDEGISKLSMALQIDPEYKKAILFIEEIFSEAEQFYNRELRNLEQNNSLSVLDHRAAIYSSLNSIKHSMENMPQLTHPKTKQLLVFELTDYTRELESSVLAVTEGYYKEGIRLLKAGERENAKAASKAFLVVMEYTPGYKDAAARELDARNEAVQSVVFLPFRGENYTVSALNANEYILDIIISQLASDSEVMKYTNIVDYSQIEPILQTQQLALSGLFDESTSIEIGKLVSANLILSGKTNLISFDYPESSQWLEQRELLVPAVFEDLEREPLEGEQFLAEVDVNLFKRTSRVKINISFKLIDIETSTIILSDSLLEEKSDIVSWAQYKGDERALNQRDIDLINNVVENETDMEKLFIESLSNLGKNIADKLRNYLR